MISLTGCLFVTVVSISYLPFTLQADSLCTPYSPSGKHYSAWNSCYWITPSNDTADNGAANCEASGGFMSRVTAEDSFLSFISDSLDNHWRPGQAVFVGLRSWTANNQFTQWDSTAIYTFKWDYTNGQPDGIAQTEFCVVLSVTSPHLWHNRKCGDIHPSLCYCELQLSSTKACAPPASSSLTSTSQSSISSSFLTTTQGTSALSSTLSSSISISSTGLVTTGSASSSATSISILTITSTVLITSVLQYCPSTSTLNLTTNSTSNTTNFDVNTLKIDKTSTNRYLRTKYSAGDTRPLSQFLGTTAIIIIVVFIGAIVAWDMTIIAQQIKIKFDQCKKWTYQKSAKVERKVDIDL